MLSGATGSEQKQCQCQASSYLGQVYRSHDDKITYEAVNNKGQNQRDGYRQNFFDRGVGIFPRVETENGIPVMLTGLFRAKY